MAAGDLRIALEAHEPPPLPVHLRHAEGRAASARLRALLDHAASALGELLQV